MTIYFKTKSTQHNKTVKKDLEFGEIHFISKSRLRSIRISVKPFEGIRVSIPLKFPHRKAQAFVERKRDWIRSALTQAHSTEQKAKEYFSDNPPLPRKEIRPILAARLDELSRKHNMPYKKLTVRSQKSRWGSCSTSNNINLNQNLHYLPDHLRDYIMLHELAHTHEKNHGPQFWNILYEILGREETHDYRHQLKAYEFLFYPPQD